MAKIKSYSVALTDKKTGKKDFKVIMSKNKENVKKRIPKRYIIAWISLNDSGRFK